MATILGIVGAVAGAAGGIAQATSGGGSQPQVQTPKAALYKPVDFTGEQLNTILGNTSVLPQINNLTAQTNSAITSQAVKRAQKLIPGYSSLMQMMGNNATNLEAGHLPYQDILDIAQNRGELTNQLGVPGTAMPGTLKDLGISQLDGMKTGASMLQNMVGIAQTVSPIDRYMTPQMMMLNPLDRIKLSMEQNQLIQQSQQNANNLEALGNSNLTPSQGTNYSSLGSSVGQLASGLGGIFGGGSSGVGTFSGYTGTGSNIPSPSSSIYSSWAPGPQSGTYYVPSASASAGLTYA